MPTTILDHETYQGALQRRYAEEAKVEERMKTKYTPGPWQAHPMEMNYGLPYTPVAANTLLAKVYSEAFGDHAQSEANARLIAAAPDLLEACMAVVRYQDLVTSGSNSGLLASYAEAYEKAKDAIAKATGELA